MHIDPDHAELTRQTLSDARDLACIPEIEALLDGLAAEWDRVVVDYRAANPDSSDGHVRIVYAGMLVPGQHVLHPTPRGDWYRFVRWANQHQSLHLEDPTGNDIRPWYRSATLHTPVVVKC